MRPPKAIEENEKNMPQELKDEKFKIVTDYLYNKKVSAEEANAVIHDFNRRWEAAGGHPGAGIIDKK